MSSHGGGLELGSSKSGFVDLVRLWAAGHDGLGFREQAPTCGAPRLATRSSSGRGICGPTLGIPVPRLVRFGRSLGSELQPVWSYMSVLVGTGYVWSVGQWAGATVKVRTTVIHA
jgi:hypothetical protein